jgi:hypothetical protein
MVMVALSLTVLLAGCAGATRAASTQKIVAAERAIHEATQSEAALTATPRSGLRRGADAVEGGAAGGVGGAHQGVGVT